MGLLCGALARSVAAGHAVLNPVAAGLVALRPVATGLIGIAPPCSRFQMAMSMALQTASSLNAGNLVVVWATAPTSPTASLLPSRLRSVVVDAALALLPLSIVWFLGIIYVMATALSSASLRLQGSALVGPVATGQAVLDPAAAGHVAFRPVVAGPIGMAPP